jgi:phosphoribosylaminoimidazole-succinocarboxamide synthase
LVTSKVTPLFQFDWPELGVLYRGKVRDCYWQGERGIIITTDRISAFDSVFPQAIPGKGAVLQSLASHFLQQASQIVPTHLIEVVDPNAMLVRKARALPVELVIRGYLTGSAWRDYQSGVFSEKYGQQLPPDLQQHQPFERPILTPTSKAQEGHDLPLTLEQASHLVGGKKRWTEIEAVVLALFEQGQKLADRRGLILADCKYELGLIEDQLTLIDELHTPDSSRYWKAPLSSPPLQMSKEFFREWLLSQKAEGVIDIPEAVQREISRRYQQLHLELLGFEVELDDTDPALRLRQNLTPWRTLQ